MAEAEDSLPSPFFPGLPNFVHLLPVEHLVHSSNIAVIKAELVDMLICSEFLTSFPWTPGSLKPKKMGTGLEIPTRFT